jgi:hypothetical protein
MRGKQGAGHQVWDALFARNPFVKSAGRRGMMDMHNFT